MSYFKYVFVVFLLFAISGCSSAPEEKSLKLPDLTAGSETGHTQATASNKNKPSY